MGPGKPVFIIAEAGVNHNGSMRLAKRLVDAAADAGADAVKFQTFRSAELASAHAGLAAYQKKTGTRKKMKDFLERYELSEADHARLWKYAQTRGIIPLSSPFDISSVDLLARMGAAAYKVPSPEITNVLLLERMAEKKKPVILSTGGSTLDEIGRAVKILKRGAGHRIALLHCVSAYPAPYEDANVRAVRTLAAKFNLPAGFSDHTLGVEMPVAAVALGACVIEKHVTLDRSMPGPDHKASIEPDELARMVSMIRNVGAAVHS